MQRKFLWSTIGIIHRYDDTATTCNEDGYISYSNSPAFIEPEWGYVFTENGHLLESLEPNFAHPKKNWRIAMPSPVQAYRAIQKKEKVVEFSSVISLRHFWEWNYYHFYLDVLGKLPLLRDAD